MMLSIPKSTLALFERTGAQIGRVNPLVVCRFVRTDAPESWYAIEFDPMDGLFYGIIAKGNDWMWGYFSQEEIQNNPDVVFDFTFKPCELAELLVRSSDMRGQ